MTRPRFSKTATLILGAALIGLAGAAAAQDAGLEAALASGAVGEQADGYLGYAKPASAEIKAKVEAINIKRRAAYTDLAAKRGVSVQDAAAATSCQTLARLPNGRAYQLPGAGWAVKQGAVKLPAFCG